MGLRWLFLFLSLASLGDAAGAGSPRVSLRIAGARPETPSAFRCGVPFAPRALDSSRPFDAVDRNGKKVPTISRAVSWWPDGSVRWMLFEGKAWQERLLLIPHEGPGFAEPANLVARSSDGTVMLEGSALRLVTAKEGPTLFRIESGSRAIRGELSLRFGGGVAVGSRVPRNLFTEELSGWQRGLRVQGELPAGNDPNVPLRFDLRLGLRAGDSTVELEFSLQNPSPWPVEVEDAELALSFAEPGKFFSTLLEGKVERVPASLQGKTWGSRHGPGKIPLSSTFCWEGSFGVCLSVSYLRELWPKEIALHSQEGIRLRFLPGKHTLSPESSVGWKAKLFLHSADLKTKEHGFSMSRMESAFTPEIVETESSGLDPRFFPRGAGWTQDLEKVLDEGQRRLFEEMDEHWGWKDFGDHRLHGRWSHLEFDTAAGLLRRALRRGDGECLRRAEQALEHWKVRDRFLPLPGSSRGGLPALHGKKHAEGSHFESGHLWVEGLLLDFAMTGNLSSREAAMQMGDALLATRSWGSDRKGFERHWAWPLIAFASLHEFFPERGYDKAMEEIVEEIFWAYRGESETFLFDGRVSQEEGVGLVNVWLSGGLLLEALDRYRQAGGKRDVGAAFRGLKTLLLREAWDRKRQRFCHTLEVDLATGQIADRWGDLKNVWEIYLISGLLRDPEKGPHSSGRILRRRLDELTRKFRWTRREAGNDFSLLLRAEGEILLGFSGS